MFKFTHAIIEKNAILLLVLTVIVIAIGGIVEIVPLFTIETTVEHVKGVRPYSPLEMAGRNIYVREGCYVCHSQQIRTLKDEVERYGHYSLAAESMYDRPFQWGSKRIGPDLARVGGKYSNDWHYGHLRHPQALVPESLMPRYAFLAETPLDYGLIEKPPDHPARRSACPTPTRTSPTPARICWRRRTRRPTRRRVLKRYPKAVPVPGTARLPHRNGRAGGLSAGARHHGRLRRSRRREAAAIGEGGMDIAAVLQWVQQYAIVPVFVVFVLMVVTTYLPSRKQEMERNARIPFDDDR